MTKKLTRLKKDYYSYLDNGARHLANKLIEAKPVTKLLLGYISDLYSSAKCEKFFENNNFESAYHNPISSDLEFLIARILYYYSDKKGLDWKIFLRRQFKNTAPDIRVEKNNRTIAIVEVKARAGWMQPFFSKLEERKHAKKFKEGKSDYDPREHIAITRKQLTKYREAYKLKRDQVFVFLPTLALVHRKKSKRVFSDYIKDFVKNSRLKDDGFIILSENLLLDLSLECKKCDYEPTKRFEKFIESISKYK